MDTLLITLTLISIIAAATMGWIAWRTTRAARQHEAARIAALAAAAGIVPRPAVASSDRPSADDRATAAVRGPAAQPPEAADVTLPSGFLAAESPTVARSSPQRALAAAAAALAVLLGAGIYTRLPDTETTERAAVSPLELLSLRHEREGTQLSVVGLVRNPAAAPALDRVSAVVLLFDQSGAFVTSAEAPLDAGRLTAGDASPFTIKVSAPQAVARYRVSFRAQAGTLPHVDRRSDTPSATPAALTR